MSCSASTRPSQRHTSGARNRSERLWHRPGRSRSCFLFFFFKHTHILSHTSAQCKTKKVPVLVELAQEREKKGSAVVPSSFGDFLAGLAEGLRVPRHTGAEAASESLLAMKRNVEQPKRVWARYGLSVVAFSALPPCLSGTNSRSVARLGPRPAPPPATSARRPASPPRWVLAPASLPPRPGLRRREEPAPTPRSRPEPRQVGSARAALAPTRSERGARGPRERSAGGAGGPGRAPGPAGPRTRRLASSPTRWPRSGCGRRPGPAGAVRASEPGAGRGPRARQVAGFCLGPGCPAARRLGLPPGPRPRPPLPRS